MKRKVLFGIAALTWFSAAMFAQQPVAEPTVESFAVFSAADTTDHYANGVVLTAFKGTLYCMWQSSPSDEDSDDTWVAYSRSSDGGQTWSRPEALAVANDSSYCTSGGWRVFNDTLMAYVDVWPKGLTPRGGYTYFTTSSDGTTWSAMKAVTMKDGTPMNGVLEQDPYPMNGVLEQAPSPMDGVLEQDGTPMNGGRLVGACHFQPGLHVCPVYTDDTTGRTGWQRAVFACEDRGAQSRCLEPSQYMASDGTLVMLFRDQGGSFRKMVSVSRDRGETWTVPAVSTLADARTKQCAGNLPQSSLQGVNFGTAFMVSCPSGRKQRWPLVLQLSRDGYTFDRRLLLRSGSTEDLPARRYEGKAKTIGFSYPKAIVHDGWLYVGYAVNKEDVAVTRIDIKGL